MKQDKMELINLNNFIFDRLNNELTQILKFMKESKDVTFSVTNMHHLYIKYVRGLTNIYDDTFYSIKNLPDEETNTGEVL